MFVSPQGCPDLERSVWRCTFKPWTLRLLGWLSVLNTPGWAAKTDTAQPGVRLQKTWFVCERAFCKRGAHKAAIWWNKSKSCWNNTGITQKILSHCPPVVVTLRCRGFVLVVWFPCVFHGMPCPGVPAGLEQLELPPKAKTAEPDQDWGRIPCWSHWLSWELECGVGLAVSWHLQSGTVTNTLFFLHLRDPFHFFVWKIYYA